MILGEIVKHAVRKVRIVPDIGHKGDRTGTAAGGGIIFAFLVISRYRCMTYVSGTHGMRTTVRILTIVVLVCALLHGWM